MDGNRETGGNRKYPWTRLSRLKIKISWVKIKLCLQKLIDERRANGEDDFQPGPNRYPVPDKPPVNHVIPDKFKTYFSNSVSIKYMSGVMVNFNYPESFKNMFEPNGEVSLGFQEQETGYK